MTRLTPTFLAFLALATFSAGITYQNAMTLIGGGGNVLNALAFAIGAAGFGFAMIVLARIIRLTARWGK